MTKLPFQLAVALLYGAITFLLYHFGDVQTALIFLGLSLGSEVAWSVIAIQEVKDDQ